MKCKPYSEITVEIGTQLKTVKITSNIFAVNHLANGINQGLYYVNHKSTSLIY